MPHLFYCLDSQPYTWTHLHRDPGPISSVLLACLGRNIQQEKAEVHTGRENAAAQGQAAANPGPKPAAAPGGQNAGQRPRQYGQPQPRYQPQPAAYGMGYNIPIKNYDPSKDYTPISMWGYFGYQLLFAIPLIGQIIILIFAFGGTKNINLRNYARSTFCLFIICLVVVLLIVLFVAIASASAY